VYRSAFSTVIIAYLIPLIVAQILGEVRVASGQIMKSIQEAPFSQGQRGIGIQGEQYGIVRSTDQVAQHVERIFTKLLRVSGKRPGAVFEVYVLDTPKILAEALPGGVVVISQGAVNLTDGDDNALAFLLAHEVAHVIRDHHGLLSSYRQIRVTGSSVPASPKRKDSGTALQAMELEADRLGLLYTSLSGYRVRSAVPILEKVIAHTGSSPFHPRPDQRAETLHATIRQIRVHLELFSLGLVYLTTGHYEEAARIYETFASLFPSREVYSNLGVAYHKWALLYQQDDGWARSVMIDSQTRARATLKDIGKMRPHAAGEKHRLFKKYMDRAREVYQLAVDSDPDYAIGHNNLGLVYLEAGEYDFAIGEFKRALRLDPNLSITWNNRAVAYAKNGDFQRAKADFLQAANLDQAYPDPHANLAREKQSFSTGSCRGAEDKNECQQSHRSK
jgi:predicted Zn-dependent protease